VAALHPGEVKELNRHWPYWARDDQLPPYTDYRNWLIMGGRGSGKTRSGAEWIRALALGLYEPIVPRCQRIAIVGPTFAEVRMVMIEGESGLLAVHRFGPAPVFNPSKRRLTWPNGTVAELFSAEEPESLRGPNFDAAWCDELAKWKKGRDVWMNLQMALRLGERPQAVITTTPRATSLMRNLLSDKSTVTTHARTMDNYQNLADSFIDDMLTRYGNTSLGRQELDGEMISDDPDALFRREDIDKFRVRKSPDMRRIVVAIDPPATSGDKANACGIVCVGLGTDGRCYVLDDASLKRATPLRWAKRAVDLYVTRGASRIIAEVNQGGDMVRTILNQIDPNLPLRTVHATRGKAARAEPVAALYEQGRISHVGVFRELEDEMCSKIGEGDSPDRLDALVWAVTELMLRKQAEPRVRGI
jgi:phage terminase large subunit-like protein